MQRPKQKSCLHYWVLYTLGIPMNFCNSILLLFGLHEPIHRGNIILTLKLAGFTLPTELQYGIGME